MSRSTPRARVSSPMSHRTESVKSPPRDRVAVTPSSTAVFQGFSVGLAEEDGGDGEPRQIAAHLEDVVTIVVDHDDAGGAGRLCGEDLQAEEAGAAVDEGDGSWAEVNDGLTCVTGHADAVVDQLDRGAELPRTDRIEDRPSDGGTRRPPWMVR